MLSRNRPPAAVLLLALALGASLAAASQKAASTVEVIRAEQAIPPAPAAHPAVQDASPGSAGVKLIILDPSVRFEDIFSGASAPLLGAVGAAYESRLLDAARMAVGSKATVVEMNSLAPPAMEACRELNALASRLARGSLNDEALAALARLSAQDAGYVVLVQFVRLKTGPGRSWNPNTGAITSSMASTLLQAALVSGNGRVIWKGEQLVRNKTMRPWNSDFGRTVALLYQNFEIN